MLNNNFFTYNHHGPHNAGLQCDNLLRANDPVWLKHVAE